MWNLAVITLIHFESHNNGYIEIFIPNLNFINKIQNKSNNNNILPQGGQILLKVVVLNTKILGLHKLVVAFQFYSTQIKVNVWFRIINVLNSPSLNFNSSLHLSYRPLISILKKIYIYFRVEEGSQFCQLNLMAGHRCPINRNILNDWFRVCK